MMFVRLALVVLVAASAGCRQALPNARPSLETLARDVLSALEGRDIDLLRQLALSESEFHDVVWPELPASRPERNLTADYVWRDTRTKSEVGLQGIVAEHGGRSWDFVRVEFGGETTQHRTFLVRREAVVIARSVAQGEQQLRLFGSVVERDGGFKVFSYNID